MSDQNIILPASDQAPAFDAERARIICRVCARQYAKYSCPRCNVRYCSLDCYKTHGNRCTEAFYKQNLEHELKGLKVEDDQRRKMVEMLKRVHENDADSDLARLAEGLEPLHSFSAAASNDDSEGAFDGDQGDSGDEEAGPPGSLSKAELEALAAALIERDISIDELPPDERARFLRLAASGELSHMIDPWAPWWLSAEAREIALRADGTPLLQEVPDTSRQAEEAASTSGEDDDPPGLAAEGVPRPSAVPLPPLSSLTAAAPPPALRWHLVDMLGAYAVCLRVYNGDVSDDPEGAAALLVALSAALAAAAAPRPAAAAQQGQAGEASGGAPTAGRAAAAQLPGTASAALEGLRQRVILPGALGLGGASFASLVAADVAALLACGRPAVVCALNHLQRILLAAATGGSAAPGSGEPLPGRGRRQRQQTGKKAMKLIERKCFFFLCWANELDASGIEDIRVSVERDAERIARTMAASVSAEARRKATAAGTRITEVTGEAGAAVVAAASSRQGGGDSRTAAIGGEAGSGGGDAQRQAAATTAAVQNQLRGVSLITEID